MAPSGPPRKFPPSGALHFTTPHLSFHPKPFGLKRRQKASSSRASSARVTAFAKMAGVACGSSSTSLLGRSTTSTPSSGHPYGGDAIGPHSGALASLGGNAVPTEVPASLLQEAASGGSPGKGAVPTGLASHTVVASHGLGGLAAVLTTCDEDRLALRAAASALEAAGVYEPADLALAGSGDDLPQGTRALILEGCQVPGVEKALEVMFVAARQGMEGNFALMSRRLTPAVRGPPPPAPAAGWSGLSGTRAECRVRTAAFGPAPTVSKRVRTGGETRNEFAREGEGEVRPGDPALLQPSGDSREQEPKV